MEKAPVYFTNLRTNGEESLLQKLERLMKKAGFENIDFEDKFVAVKIHFGEPGNLAYLRPNWARTVCDYIKRLGGKPFLTDCNTLYVGGRKNALDHLDSAYVNGYNPIATGVQTIIADGLKGLDERDLPVPNGEYCKTAKIGSDLADADIIISMSHVKGHGSAGFGGVLNEQKWATYDESLCQDETVEIVVQICGKVKTKLNVPVGAEKDEVLAQAAADPKIASLIEGKQMLKQIYVQNKLVNFVVK